MNCNDDDDKEYIGKQNTIVHVRTHSSEEDETLEKGVNEPKKPRLFNSFTQRLSVEIPKNDDLFANLKTTEAMLDGYSDDEHEPEMVETVPKESIFQRIDSHKETKSFQLGRQLSCKWSTGAGPRIGCLRDYPSELQSHTLEQANLSPRSLRSFNRRNNRPYRTQSSPLKAIPGDFIALLD